MLQLSMGNLINKSVSGKWKCYPTGKINKTHPDFFFFYRSVKVSKSMSVFHALLLKVVMLVNTLLSSTMLLYLLHWAPEFFSAFIFYFFWRTACLGSAAQLRCYVWVEVVLNHLLLKLLIYNLIYGHILRWLAEKLMIML